MRSPIMDPERGMAMWPEQTRPVMLFGKEYVWVRECPARDVLAPHFDVGLLPLTLHRVER